MIQRKLSKPQSTIFLSLAQQKAGIQQAMQQQQRTFMDLLEAEKEQLEMLRRHFDLPEGEYHVRQEPGDGALVLFRAEKPAEAQPRPAQGDLQRLEEALREMQAAEAAYQQAEAAIEQAQDEEEVQQAQAHLAETRAQLGALESLVADLETQVL